MSIFLKKMTLLADVFMKLRTQKNLFRSMAKKSRLKVSFEKQHGKDAQTLLKCQRQLLYDIYWSLGRQLTCKRSLLVKYKISRLFPNTLVAYGKYSVFNRGNLVQQKQKQKTKIKNFFSIFFCIFEI